MSGIELEVTMPVRLAAHYIEIAAGVCYWEDSAFNGVEDIDGTLVPFKKGNDWCPIIELDSGKFVDWPAGTDAFIYYKVCDQGNYWLLDENKKRIAKWKGVYVPDDILCIGENGYGDYIIMSVNNQGGIENWKAPELDGGQWQLIEVAV